MSERLRTHAQSSTPWAMFATLMHAQIVCQRRLNFGSGTLSVIRSGVSRMGRMCLL
jgi:hypothetical protein